MKDIKDLVKDSEWQKLRQSLVGRWKEDPVGCVRKLRQYLGTINKTSDDKLRITMNYLVGTGFRTGVIKHPEISKLRKEISEEMKRRKD